MKNKPCPFCGKSVALIPWRDEENEGWVAYCHGNDEEEGCDFYFGLEEWNNRPIEDDLLAALKAILDVDNPPAGTAGHIDFKEAIEMGKQAIAKAEGGCDAKE
jgi:hypothetical protein